MLTTSEFIHFLLASPASEKPISAALCNYIKSYQYPLENELPFDLTLEFINCISQFPFWQKNQEHSEKELIEIFSWFRKNGYPDMTSSRAKALCRKQIIALKNDTDILEALMALAPEQCRAIKAEDNKYILIRKTFDEEILVTSHTNSFFLQKGRVLPTFPIDKIYYNSSFRIIPTKTQSLLMAPNTWVRFQLDSKYGALVEGPKFNKVTSFQDDKNISQATELKLKDLEKHYVRAITSFSSISESI